MQESENDYIKKEVKKLILFLQNMFNKILSDVSVEESIVVLNEKLTQTLGFTFLELLEAESIEEKIKGIDISILEELYKVLYAIFQKEEDEHNKLNIVKSINIIIKEIENNTNTFSLERMKIKTNLKL